MGDEVNKEQDVKTEVADGSQATEAKPEEKKHEGAEQQISQERANAEKARKERDKVLAEKEELETQYLTMSDELDAQKTESSAIKQELAQVRASIEKMTKASAVDSLGNLDEAGVDPSVVKHIKKLQEDKFALEAQHKEMNENIKSLQKTKEQFEAEKIQQQQTTYKEQQKEKILSRLDKEFGAKYRNEAVELANTKVREAGKAPIGEIAIMELIWDCYKEVVAKEPKPDTKKTVPVDDGKGGVPRVAEEKTTGRVDDIWQDVYKKYKTKG